jgi:hypothetical protein
MKNSIKSVFLGLSLFLANGSPVYAQNYTEALKRHRLPTLVVAHDAAKDQDAKFIEKYGNGRDTPLGSGPHVLIISKRGGEMTQLNYRTGKACQLARDSVRKQIAPPANAIRPIINGQEPPLTAVCVPR